MESEESQNTDKTKESNNNESKGLGALATSMLSTAAFISKAPVTYTDINKSALQFRPRTTLGSSNRSSSKARGESDPGFSVAPKVKSSRLDDWINKDNEDEEQQEQEGFGGIAPFDLRKSKNRRWSKRKRLKRQEVRQEDEINPDDVPWDDEYLIDQPNSYLVYMESDERFMEDEDWRQYLLGLKQGQPKQIQIDQSELDVEPDLETMGGDRPMEAQQVKVSSLPGQKQFAQREMAKYGWVKGEGLGNASHGITQALQVSIDKTNRGHGKIVDKSRQGRSKKEYENSPFENDEDGDDGGGGERGKFGRTSSVIILRDMVSYEDALTDESLVQEIGQECESKYGPVERVFIHTLSKEDSGSGVEGANVYVKFTSELSALGAVNGLNGRLFGGSKISGRFYGSAKFANSVYSNVL